eukprot:GEMP01045280.1.p1 GENE.GEMP01045280.1~~GEMP01045280.1.p1  ORF type:complete len:283 (+),score=22.69 GEMP01045280.1:95-943(+)
MVVIPAIPSIFSGISDQLAAISANHRVLELVSSEKVIKGGMTYFPVLLWAGLMYMSGGQQAQVARVNEKLHSLVSLQECLLLSVLIYSLYRDCQLPTVFLFISSAYKFILSCMHREFVVQGTCRDLHVVVSVVVLLLLPRTWFKALDSSKRQAMMMAGAGSFFILQSGIMQITDRYTLGVAYQLILILDLFCSMKFFFDSLNEARDSQVLILFTTYQLFGAYVWLHFLDVIPDFDRLGSLSHLRAHEGFMEEIASHIAILIVLLAVSSTLASSMNHIVGKVK